MTRIEEIGHRFDQFQKNGDGYVACCPAHDDSKPSLAIREGKDGRILVKCHAGCDTREVLESVGLDYQHLMPNAKVPWNIVATYDYLDAEGKLLYQNVRLDPKDFRLRRPDGNGGWIYKEVLEGIERVPYRLPEMLEREDRIYVPEGEKDCDRLIDELGLCATTNVGGAGKWRTEYNQWFRGRHVVILPDNDLVGWDHAKDVAEELVGVAKSVRILELPDLPEKGDVSDWLDAGGNRKQLLRLLPKALAYDPTTLRPYGQAEGNDPTTLRVTLRSDGEAEGRRAEGPVGLAKFPVEAFPKLLQKFVESVATALPCPPDYPGTLILPVLGTAIGRKRRLQIKPGWEEWPLLWAAVVARSGDRKTPAFIKATEPLRHQQRALLATYLSKLEAWEALPPKEQKLQPRPRLQQVVTTDSTIEALKGILDASPKGICFTADELSGWARAMSQYKAGKGDDRQHWLSIWSSVQVVCNRTGRDPIIIEHPFVGVAGGIQPQALRDLVDLRREDGFAARILFSYPDPLPNANWTDDQTDHDLLYGGICTSLWDLPVAKDQPPITFSPTAKEVWVEWVNRHRAEQPPDNLRPVWSKSEGYCARLALILFLSRVACNETTSDTLDEQSIEGAIKLINYFKSHARRVYGHAVDQVDTGRIGNGLAWVQRHGGTVTARMAHQYGIVKDTEAAIKLFQDLESLGYGVLTEKPQNSWEFKLNSGPPTLRASAE